VDDDDVFSFDVVGTGAAPRGRRGRGGTAEVPTTPAAVHDEDREV